MQMSMLTYPNFSQFLQLHHQQQQLQQQFARVDTQSSETSADTSPSPSPPLSPRLTPPLSVPDKVLPGKSFTIDAILGLQGSGREPLAFHSAFHPRLRVSDLSRLSGVLSSREETPSYTSPRSSDKSLGESSKKCSGKSKRVRTIFTPEQLERLEAEFERQQYMVGPERLYLAHTLQLTEAQVKVWFQNRRIKWRKQHLELQQQRLAVLKQRHHTDAEDSGDSEDSGTGGKFPPFGPDMTQGANFGLFAHENTSDTFPHPLSFAIENSRNSQQPTSPGP